MLNPDLPTVELQRTLGQGPRLRLALLFGSQAKGGAHAGSDVDIAVLPADPELSLRDELGLQAALTRVLAREVDLVRLDRASTLVRHQVARDGVVLLESGPFERSRFVASAIAEYLDCGPALARAASLFRRTVAQSRPRNPSTCSISGQK